MNFDLDKLAVELAEHLKKITGLNHLVLRLHVDKKDRLCVESNELQDYMYPKMFKELRLSEFGGGWVSEDVQGDDQHGLDSVYWLPIKYRYTHFGIGTNGCDCAEFLIKGNEILEVINKLE